MSRNLDFTHIDASPLPDEVKELVSGLLEGRVKTLIVVAELQDNDFLEGIFVDLDGNTSHRYAVIGAIESVKRDFMRMEVESRVEYLELDDISIRSDDDDEEQEEN